MVTLILMFHIMFPVPPVIKEGSSVVTAHVNEEAFLPCEVEGDFTPTVIWRKDGFPLPQDNTK